MLEQRRYPEFHRAKALKTLRETYAEKSRELFVSLVSCGAGALKHLAMLLRTLKEGE